MSLRVELKAQHNNLTNFGQRGAVVWREGNMVEYVPPDPCHCGGTAIYREGQQGFCKNHRDDAVKAAKKKARRYAQ